MTGWIAATLVIAVLTGRSGPGAGGASVSLPASLSRTAHESAATGADTSDGRFVSPERAVAAAVVPGLRP